MRFSHTQKLILASTSPYRQQLLRGAGINFSAQSPLEVDEDKIHGSDPSETALLRAIAKAEAVAAKQKSAIVIGCDQVMDFSGMTLGKANSEVEAVERLKKMSGKTHFLHNGLAILNVDALGRTEELCREVNSVSLRMRTLSNEEISAYIATGEWQGSAGAYKIEGRGIFLFEKIDGLQADIIGLPLLNIFKTLKRHGINLLLSQF